jgi:hypothetical protein
MVEFRCWYCNRKHQMPQQRVGERFLCACDRPLRVPRYSGGRCRIRSLADWLVEAVAYGGGGALLGLGLALVLLSLLPRYIPIVDDWLWIPPVVLPLAGFLLGLLGGERGIGWIGRMIRDFGY